MSVQLAEASYVGDLGSGLVRRWSTAADVAKIGDLLSRIYRPGPEAPLNIRAIDEVRVFLTTDFTFMGSNDFAIVEDQSRPEHPVVACACFFRHEWSYAGIRFGVGRPEDVATDPDYRHRGLVRALFDMIHARSAAEGHLVQAITGIPYFYRQFGYEFVLDLEGERIVNAASVPTLKDGEKDAYHLRPATVDDIPDLEALYNQRRQTSLVWHEAPQAYWRHLISSWDDPAIRGLDATQNSRKVRLQMIVDDADRTLGFVWADAKRWNNMLRIEFFELYPEVNWPAAAPALLRALCELGNAAPPVRAEAKPFDQLRFMLGRTHPLYDVLGETLISHVEQPYAWYLRVPDVPAFIRCIAPVLEERLARSVLTGYTGELKIDQYRGGLRMQFEQGKLVTVEPWQIAPFEDAPAGCPPLVFLQLLFSYRSLAALHGFFPDVWADQPATLLINTLFPTLPSFVHPLA